MAQWISCKREDLGSDSQDLCKKLNANHSTWSRDHGSRQIPETHCLVSLAESLSFTFRESPCLKYKSGEHFRTEIQHQPQASVYVYVQTAGLASAHAKHREKNECLKINKIICMKIISLVCRNG